LAAELAGRHEVIGLDRQALDLSKPDELAAALDGLDFDVLVNPAAVTSRMPPRPTPTSPVSSMPKPRACWRKFAGSAAPGCSR
jgi:hypothetical protein